MLDAKVGENPDCAAETGAVAEEGSRLSFEHSLVGDERVAQDIDPQKASSASDAEGESGPRIVAEHVEAEREPGHPANFGPDGGHGGDRLRWHGGFPERHIAVVLNAERTRPARLPGVDVGQSALQHGFEPPIVSRSPRQRLEVNEADQELGPTGGQGDLHKSGHDRIFTKSGAWDKRLACALRRAASGPLPQSRKEPVEKGQGLAAFFEAEGAGAKKEGERPSGHRGDNEDGAA